MTLKTGVMASDNSALPIKMYSNRVQTETVILDYNDISQYYCFYCIFD